MMISDDFRAFCFTCLILLVAACTHNAVPGNAHSDRSYDQLMVLARTAIDNRNHSEALEILEAAGKKAGGRPEWAFEQGRAFFYMGQFAASAKACRKALDRNPNFQDALALSWAARLEAAERSVEMKELIRNEIEALRNRAQTIEALMTVYNGYSYLKDKPAQRRVMLQVASLLESGCAKATGEIAPAMFEQIIGARDPSEREAKLRLMQAYARNFPEGRFADYVIYQLLEAQHPEVDSAEATAILKITPFFPGASWRQKVGVARWLLERGILPEKAVGLLTESLVLARKALEEMLPYFTDSLWQEEREKTIERIRYLIGRAWFDAQEYDRAEAAFVEVAENGRRWSGVYHYLGMIARERKDFDNAIVQFRQALMIEPRADSSAALGELLESEYGYVGDPALYFPQKTISVYFTDVTASAGLTGVGASRVAWGDYDGDGHADLLFDGHRLFRNAGDGRFEETTVAAGLAGNDKANGGVWGDYDNDGTLDFFVAARTQNRLFRNSGDGTFVETTAKAFGASKDRPTEAAAWGDLDNDGDLDLYIVNYERHGVMRAIGTHDRLLRNNGDGTFSDISRTAGIEPDEAMCGRGVVWTDIEGDGYQEIVVANYRLDPNFCWAKQGPDLLADAAESFGVRGTNVAGAYGHSIGPVSGDLNNDGHIDLFVSNLAHPRYIEFSDQDMLLINGGAPDYALTDRYFESGIAFEETNSDPALADVDNDGDLDLYIGSIYSGRYSHLYLNDGQGRFSDASWYSGTRVQNAWGTAFADFDNDGFVDLLVASIDGVRFFRNQGNGNHWMKINVEDRQCNRFGIGSRVTISYGGKRQVREIAAGRGAGSQDEAAVVFGLGTYSGPVSVTIRTLCGDEWSREIDSPDCALTLTDSKHKRLQ